MSAVAELLPHLNEYKEVPISEVYSLDSGTKVALTGNAGPMSYGGCHEIPAMIQLYLHDYENLIHATFQISTFLDFRDINQTHKILSLLAEPLENGRKDAITLAGEISRYDAEGNPFPTKTLQVHHAASRNAINTKQAWVNQSDIMLPKAELSDLTTTAPETVLDKYMTFDVLQQITAIPDGQYVFLNNRLESANYCNVVQERKPKETRMLSMESGRYWTGVELDTGSWDRAKRYNIFALLNMAMDMSHMQNAPKLILGGTFDGTAGCNWDTQKEARVFRPDRIIFGQIDYSLTHNYAGKEIPFDASAYFQREVRAGRM